MPTYEYACTACEEHLEVVQSFKDEPLTECPACGGPLRKVFAPIGVVFKGSGFYKTDTRSSQKSAKPAANGDKAAGDTSSSGDSSGDTKAPSPSGAPKEKSASSSGGDSKGSSGGASGSGAAAAS